MYREYELQKIELGEGWTFVFYGTKSACERELERIQTERKAKGLCDNRNNYRIRDAYKLLSK